MAGNVLQMTAPHGVTPAEREFSKRFKENQTRHLITKQAMRKVISSATGDSPHSHM